MANRIQIKSSQTRQAVDPLLRVDVLSEYAPVRNIANTTLRQAAQLATTAIGAKAAAVCWVSSNTVRLVTTYGMGANRLARSLPKDFYWFAPSKAQYSSEDSVLAQIQGFLGLDSYKFLISLPLWSYSGHVMGSLLILDETVRRLEDEQLELLTGIADLAMDSINAALFMQLNSKIGAAVPDADLTLSHALRQARESMVMFELDGTVTAWNSGAEEIFGYPSQRMLGQSIQAIIPNSDQAAFLQLINQVQHKFIAPREVMRLHQSGFRVLVRSSIQAIRNAGGAVVGILEICGVPTDTLRAATTEQFQSLVQNLPMIFLQTDIRGCLTFIEGHVPSRYRGQNIQMLGMSVAEVFADIPMLLPTLNRALQGESLHLVLSWHGRSFETWIVPLLQNSRLVGCNVLALDISQQLQTAAQLEQTQSDLETVINQLPMLLVKADLQGQITSIHGGALNKVRAAHIISERRASVGNALAEDLSESNGALELFARASGGERVNGLVHWRDQIFDSWIEPTFEAGKPSGTLAIALDVTERMNSQSRLLELSKRIEQLLDSLPILAIAIDLNGCITLLEGKGVMHFGGQENAEQLLGLSLNQIFQNDATIANLVESALEGGEFNAAFDFMGLEIEVFVRPILQAGRLVGSNAIVLDTSAVSQVRLEKRQALEELMQTKTALAQEQAFALTVLETIEQGVTVKNGAGEMQYVSPVLARMLGYEPEELLGTKMTDLTVPGQEIRLQHALEDRRDGWQTTYQVDLLRKDGQVRTLEITGYPMRNTQGQLTGNSVAVGRDITFELEQQIQMQAVQNQLEQERQYTVAIANTIQHGLVIFDTQQVAQYLNPALVQMLGYTVADLQNIKTTDLIPPEDLHIFADTVALRRAGQSSAFRIRVRHQDGRILHIEGYGSPRFDTDGQFIGTIVSLQNITQQLALEQATHRARRELERESRNALLVANSITDGLLFIGADDVVQYANPAILKMLGGVGSKSVVGSRSVKWVASQDIAKITEEYQLIFSGQTRNFRIQLKTGLPRSVFVDITSYPRMETGQFNGSIVVLRDISAELEPQDFLETQALELHQSEQRYRQLYEQSQLQSRHLALIDTIHRAASFAKTTQELIKAIVESISQTLDIPMVSIYLVKDNKLVQQHAVGYSSTIVSHDLDKGGVMARSVKTRQTMLIDDASSEPDFVHLSGKIQSELCVPIMTQNAVLGVINLESEEIAAFTTQDAQLIAQIAERIRHSIEITRALDDLRLLNQKRLDGNKASSGSHQIILPSIEAALGFMQGVGGTQHFIAGFENHANLPDKKLTLVGRGFTVIVMEGSLKQYFKVMQG